MPKVKTLKYHTNSHGSAFVKKKGTVYDHPNPAAVISSGFVEEVKTDDIQGKSGGVSRDGKKPLSPKKHDGKGDGETGDEKSTDTDKGRGKQ